MAEPEPSRYADRVVVLLEGCAGLMARTNRLDKVLRLEEKRFRALKEPEWKGVRAKLLKAFPELPDLSRDSKIESFQARANETVTELRHAYELFQDLALHAALHLETLRALLGSAGAWDLDAGRETARGTLKLFSAYVRLLYLASTLEDRKVVVALYAAAHDRAGKGRAPGYDDVAKRFVPRLDDCFRHCCDAFKEHVGAVAELVKNQLELAQLACGGGQELLRRSALTMLEDNAALGQPSEAPLRSRDKGKHDCRMLHHELLECRDACDFACLATLACPGVLAEASGMALAVAKLCCEDALVVGVYRGCTLNVHAELEYLAKWFPPRGYPGRWPRDLKLAKLFKEWSKAAVQNCGLWHRERRAYVLGELDASKGLLEAVPGLAAPKGPLVLASVALARDELLWALRHAPDRGAAALPPKYRLKHYAPENFAAADLAPLAGLFSQVACLLRRERRTVAEYHVAYLATADAEACGAAGLKARTAAPEALASILESLKGRLEGLKGATDDAVAAGLRAERDGRCVGGDWSASGIKASQLATLRVDWRRAHAALACSRGGEALKDADVAEVCRYVNKAIDHAGLADGSLLLEHADAGALWPFRHTLLRTLDHAIEKGSDPSAPARLVHALLETARYARRTLGHPACEHDAIELESDARALGEAAVARLAAAVGGCLRAITGSLEQLAAQVAPVEAAYRLERREAAIRDAEKKGLERPREQPPAGYESLPRNERAIAPLIKAETRLAALLELARWDFSDAPGRRARDSVVVVGDAKLRPLEYARGAVTAFLSREIPRAFFVGDPPRLQRPSNAERTYGSLIGAAARAAGYFDVDYCGHVVGMLGGPPGWRDAKEELQGHSPLAEQVAGAYVAAVRSLPPHVVYCPQHKCWRSTAPPVVSKKGVPEPKQQSHAEQLLCGQELDALLRVLGADGARCLDAHLCRAAVDEMARCKKTLGAKSARPLFEQVRKGTLTGAWLPAATQLKADGVLDQLLAACWRLGNVLALRQLVRESHARASREAAPHLMAAAELCLDAAGSGKACEIAPAWLLPPAKKPHDPTYHHPVDDDAADGPLYRALTAPTPFGPDPYERDGNLHREARGVVESPDDFRPLPWALAAAFYADAWKPCRWLPDLAALSPGFHVVAHALRALAHVSSGPLDDPGSPARAEQCVADFVAAGAAIVTHMRIHEKMPEFVELPLRAQCAFLEIAAVDANLPRSYLERHLPYAVIHAALMDVAMGHQTAADDARRPFDPAVFD